MPRLFAVSLLLLSVAACGQRGPLYLPSQGIPASQRAPASTSAKKTSKAEQSPEQPADATRQDSANPEQR
ncbi:MAG: hypothetical protein EPN72_09060 [Nevskiaceae bacterium]|nr:MAG: hypothetical protein EPN63_08400 [Nevskiaceae bacterium]TBR72588.1 MAG: hypothetical protein EPN72_09060 [Nevskiaceae bacterium]